MLYSCTHIIATVGVKGLAYTTVQFRTFVRFALEFIL